MAYQSQDIIRRSATNGFTPRLTTSRRWRSLSTSPPVSAVKHVRWPAPNGTIFVMKSVTMSGCMTTGGPDRQVMDGHALLGGGTKRQAGMAHPQGWLHALRGPGLPEGLPVRRRDHSVRQRHCRLPVRAVHRLRLLYRRLSVRCTASEPGRQPRLQMYPVRRPRDRRPSLPA